MRGLSIMVWTGMPVADVAALCEVSRGEILARLLRDTAYQEPSMHSHWREWREANREAIEAHDWEHVPDPPMRSQSRA